MFIFSALQKVSVLVAVLALLNACSKNLDSDPAEDVSPVTFKVEEAPEWTALFKRSEGWFGGDGIFAIPFSGNDFKTASSEDSILFVFSDTMVGEIKDGKLTPGYKMINNSIMVLKGGEADESSADFRVNRDDAGEPRTIFVPRSPQSVEGDYFWLGDGFVNNVNGNMYIFAYRIRNTHTADDFPFREVGNTLLVIPQGSKYPYNDHRQLDLSFSDYALPGPVSFGVGILDNSEAAGVPSPDGYLYVYGIRGSNKELVAARMKPEAIEDFSSWEFWDGGNWSSNFKASAPLADSVSNELSVSPIGNNQYALIYQYGGIYPTIYMQVGSSPVGPFGPRRKLWETTDYLEDKELFSYNAKAHPAISKPGELLVSYNVNSFKFFEVIEKMPNLYRPRFFRIKFNNQ